MDLQIGDVYGGKYRVLRTLGQGAMGAVYEAENIRISRHVAVKVLHAGVVGRSDVVQRFEREAQAAGRIGSRHIVEVLDMGDLPDGSRFMVMEFLEGTTLEQRIRSKGRLLPEEISPIAVQLLDGLGAAHRAGIIHRDLKPANIFLAPGPNGGDFVKILDFGVSKFNAMSEMSSMTSTGAVLGTPFYMSPEQAKGSRGIDARSDIYSVGVILYESITGQVPFSAQTFNELIFRIVLESPPPAESFVPNLDPQFAAILRCAMAREPDQRYSSADELRTAIETWLARPLQTTMIIERIPRLGAGGTLMMDPPSLPPQSFAAPLSSVVEAPTLLPTRKALPMGAWAAAAAGVVTLVALLAVALRSGPSDSPAHADAAESAANRDEGGRHEAETVKPPQTPTPSPPVAIAQPAQKSATDTPESAPAQPRPPEPPAAPTPPVEHAVAAARTESVRERPREHVVAPAVARPTPARVETPPAPPPQAAPPPPPSPQAAAPAAPPAGKSRTVSTDL